MDLFFWNDFFSPEIDCFFENQKQSNARKKHVFFGNARPKSNARARLKQRKKT